jgi:hypothetical protein
MAEGVRMGRPLGGKNSIENINHKALALEIAELAKAKVSPTGIKKVLGITRHVLEAVVAKYNIKLHKRTSDKYLKVLSSESYIKGKLSEAILDKDRDYLMSLILAGHFTKEIIAKVKEKYPDIATFTVRRYIKNDPELFPIMIKTHNQLREIGNINCSKARKI